jgi:hypothetical protein
MLRNLLFYFIVITLFIECSPRPISFDSPWLGKSATSLKKNLGNPDKIEKTPKGEKWIYAQKITYFGKKPPKENMEPTPKFNYIIERIFSIDNNGTIYYYEVFKYKEKVKPTKN